MIAIRQEVRKGLRVAAVVAVMVVLGAASATAQFLPWPLTTPVMDVLRREAAATYADQRASELQYKVMERLFDEMTGLGIDEYTWRSVVTTLDDVEGALGAGASLGYRAEGLIGRVDGLFRVTEGYSPYTDRGERWEAMLETYRAMASTGVLFADDLEAASETVGTIKEQVEQIGQGFYGFVELGSHQESAQSESQAAIMAAEEMVQMRESIAMQTNADVIAFMERIAEDRLFQILITCHLTGEGCPLESTWEDDWDGGSWEPGDDEDGEDGDEDDDGEEGGPWCFMEGSETCCLDPETMEITCEGGDDDEEDEGTCYDDDEGFHCYDDEQVCHTDGENPSWCEPRHDCEADGDDYCCTDIVTGETTCEPLEACATEGDQRCCLNQETEVTTCENLEECYGEGSDYCCTNAETGETTCEPLEDGACWMEGDETECCYGEDTGIACSDLFECEAEGDEYCCTDLETDETMCEPLEECVESGDQWCCTNAQTDVTTCGPIETCETVGDEYCCTDQSSGETECVPTGECRPEGEEVCCFNADTGIDSCEPAEDNQCIEYDGEACCFDAVRGRWRCTPL